MTSTLRIAILAHSTNPRGGVVHALEVGDALTRLGHEVTIHAPDRSGTGFFRKTLCNTTLVPVAQTSVGWAKAAPKIEPGHHAHSAVPINHIRPVTVALAFSGGQRGRNIVPKQHASAAFTCPAGSADRTEVRADTHNITAMVEARIDDYLRHFERAGNRQFDIWHAQDGISANALATLKERGLIAGFARTVHHVDDFADPRLVALQTRGIVAADVLLTVSRLWHDWLRQRLSRKPAVIGNGVDIDRFSPIADDTDDILRARLGLQGNDLMLLSVGGVEARKNTVRILDAFARVHSIEPRARLVIAGGASILDHDAYRTQFRHALVDSGLRPNAVMETGPLPQELMPALYRAAHVLVFPSVSEGFGLVVLEAMASGVPVIVSRIAPFTEYLCDDVALWCDPFDAASIATAMMASLDPSRWSSLAARGSAIAARHHWMSVAQAHFAPYRTLREPAHA